MCAAFALATAAGKFFDTNLQWKSHLTFGQVTSVSFNLLYYNKHLANFFTENKDPQKRDVLFGIFIVMHCIIPITLGRLVTNRCFERTSWIQMGKRGLYLGVFGGAILYGSVLYEREKKKPES